MVVLDVSSVNLKDLTPLGDIKGGEPSGDTTRRMRPPTPRPMPVSEYQETMIVPRNGISGTAGWMVAIALGGLLCGCIIAYFTALQAKGITQSQMEEYVEKRLKFDKEFIAGQNQAQDISIGEIRGIQKEVLNRLSLHDTRLHDDEKDLNEMRTKMDIVANFLEETKKPKK